MSTLTITDKTRLEGLLRMGDGYVLNFSNRTFREFILDSVNRDIYSDAYGFKGDSKANRLRAFWEVESNYLVANLIESLLDYWLEINRGESLTQTEEGLFVSCREIVERLRDDRTDEVIQAFISPSLDDKDFALLASTIRESLIKDEPEAALDRLHTYTFKYVRRLCDKHGITYEQDTPLHSCFGGYVKFLKQNAFIDSTIAERILRSTISIMDAFNDVRNNKSFAHDNPVLNSDESMLIFRNMSSLIHFVDSIESRIDALQDTDEDELLF